MTKFEVGKIYRLHGHDTETDYFFSVYKVVRRTAKTVTLQAQLANCHKHLFFGEMPKERHTVYICKDVECVVVKYGSSTAEISAKHKIHKEEEHFFWKDLDSRWISSAVE